MTAPHALWDSCARVPERKDLMSLDSARTTVIRAHDAESFVHGASLVVRGSELWCSFAHNTGPENTRSETAQLRRSTDWGATWGEDECIAGPDDDVGVSHGVFVELSDGRLAVLLGTVSDGMRSISTRRYILDGVTGRWGDPTWVADGFWPLQQPLRSAPGVCVMAGVWKSDHLPYLPDAAAPPAVLVSTDDMEHWQMVVPYVDCPGPFWGESSILTGDGLLVWVARSSREVGRLLVSVSDDDGRSWSPMRVSTMPFTSSKPHIGRLSTGVPYLIGASYAGVTGDRSTLTVSVGAPGGYSFARTARIRSCDDGQGPDRSSHGSLSYPHALEHDGRLYVAYSNDGGRRRNLNSLQLTTLDVAELDALGRACEASDAMSGP